MSNNNTQNLISFDEVIRLAKLKGVNFGKGDPYNRLRYYIKIGLLPKASRKSFNGLAPAGALPISAVDQMVEIDQKIKQGNSIQTILKESQNPSPVPTQMPSLSVYTPTAASQDTVKIDTNIDEDLGLFPVAATTIPSVLASNEVDTAGASKTLIGQSLFAKLRQKLNLSQSKTVVLGTEALVILIGLTFLLSIYRYNISNPSKDTQSEIDKQSLPTITSGESGQTLAESVRDGLLSVYVPTNITGQLTAEGGIVTNDADINAGTGKITASNVIYSLTAGSNVSITGGQNAVISVGNVAANISGTANRITVSGNNINIASNYAGQSSISTVGTITSGTWAAGTITDTYVSDTLSINNTGSVDWTALTSYPTACGVNEFVRAVGDSLTCATDQTGAGATIDIEVDDSPLQSATALDFLANDFNVVQDGLDVNEVNISIDYTNSGITRRNTNETLAATWTVGNGASIITSGSGFINANRFAGSGSTTDAVDLATSEINGTLAILNGGTGATTSQGAINNISQLTTEGDLLYHNGTNSTRLPRGSDGQCLAANATTIVWGSCGLGAEADTLLSVTTRGASTTVASSFTGGATIRGLTLDTATGTDDLLSLSVTTGGAARFTGNITQTDLSANRTYTLPNADGTFAISAASPLSLNVTTGNLTLGTVAIANGGTGATTSQGAINAISQLTTEGDLLYHNGVDSTRFARGANGTCLGSNASTIAWVSCGVGAEADTLATVTGRGATTGTASSFTGGLTSRGITIDSATGTDDLITLSITGVGAAQFTGTITNTDLTSNRTYTLPNAGGTFAVSASSPLSLNATTGDLTLGTVAIANGGTGATTSQGAINNLSQLTTEGDLLYYNGTNSTRFARGSNGTCLGSNASTIAWVSCGVGAEADTLATVTGRGATTGTASSFTGGATIRGLTVDTATATDDLIALSVTTGGAARFTGTISSADLTNNRSYTLPDVGGTFALSGNLGNSLEFSSNVFNVKLPAAADGLSTTTNSGSGLEVLSGGLTLLQGCADTQILKWSESNDRWECQNDSGVGAEADTLATVTGRGSTTTVAITTRGITVDNATANSDLLSLSVTAVGSNTFTGTITNADLTANRTYTLPDVGGTFALSGNLGNSLEFSSNLFNVKLPAAANGLSSTINSGSGLEILSGGLTLLQGCADTQVLKWDEANDYWACANDSGLGSEADTLATVTGRGATTTTASSFTGGATIRGLTIDTATGTDDLLAVSVTTGGAGQFTGTITNTDLTANRTYTLPNIGGTFANSGNIGNSLEFSSNTFNVKLPAAADALSSTTNSGSGLEILSGGLTLLQGCADTQILKWDETNDYWACAADSGVGAEADTLATVTGRGATTGTASSFTGGLTARGITVDTATGTDDLLTLSVTAGGAARFTGTITNADLTDNRSYTLPNVGGTFALSGNLGNSLEFSSNLFNVKLPAAANGLSTTTESGSGLEILSGGLTLLQGCSTNQILKWNETDDEWECQNDSGLTAESDTLATVTGRGASTSTASTFTGGLTSRGITIDTATGTDDLLALSVTTGGAARFTGTITSVDLTGTRTYTLPDVDGTFATSGNLGNSLTFGSNVFNVKLPAAADALSSTTNSGSGLEILSGGLTLLQGCSDTQILKWSETNDRWECQNDSGVGAEADTLATVTGRGASTGTASIFTGGLTSRGITIDSATGTDDLLTVTINGVGGARFTGTITHADLTADRTYTLPNAGGTFAVSASSPLSLSANGDISLGTVGIGNGGTGATTSQGAINNLSQLNTEGDLLYHNGTNSTRLGRGSDTQCLKSNATTIVWGSCGLGTEADTLATVTGRGATTTTASSFTGGATIRGLTIDTATGTDDLLAVSVTAGGAARFTGTITATDLTANRQYTLPNAGGTFAVSASSPLSLSALGDISLGTVGIGNGGTGATTSQGAINAISQLTTEGDLLYHNGTNSTRLPKGSNGQCLTSNTTTIVWNACGIASESDTLQTVTGRGATTTTASSFTGGLTARGITVDTATGTDDLLTLSVTTGGAAQFTGSISAADLTSNRTYTLPNVSGTFASSGNLGESLIFSSNLFNVKLPAAEDNLSSTTFSGSGLEIITGKGLTLLQGCAEGQVLKWDENVDDRWECQNDSGVGAEADTLQTVTSRGAITTTASSFTGGATIRGLTIDTATGTDDLLSLSVTAGGANQFTGAITASDLTSNRTYTLPNASGTFAVSASSPISLSALGGISCSTCLTTSTTLFTLTGTDAGTNQTITSGDTLTIAAGTGIDTTPSNTDILTVAFDSTEIGTTTWGSGSNFTWTFNPAGATNPTIAFADGSIILSDSLTFSGYTTDGGLLYTDNTGVVGQISAGALNNCLLSAGAGNPPTWGSCGIAVEADTLATVTGRGATTTTASSFTGGLTARGITVDTATGTDDLLTLSVTAGGAARFTGTISSTDLTNNRSYTLPDVDGTFATSGNLGNSLTFGSNVFNVKLPSSADALSSTTNSASGLEILSGGLTLLQGCSNNQILKWNENSDYWACGNDVDTSGGGEDLQATYNLDGDGSNVTISLTNVDGSLVFQNTDIMPSTTDFVLSLEQEDLGSTTTNFKTLNTVSTGSFDTTAGNLVNYSGYFNNTSTESAGGNVLTNVGIYASASGADNNYAAIFLNGNVGIGNNAPGSRLEVGANGATNELITVKSQRDSAIELYADTDDTNEDDNPYIFFSQDNGSYQAILGLTGQVATDPRGDAYTNTRSNALLLGGMSGATELQFGTNGSVRATFDANGNFGIGDTTPEAFLNVDLGSANQVLIEASAAPTIDLLSLTNTGFGTTTANVDTLSASIFTATGVGNNNSAIHAIVGNAPVDASDELSAFWAEGSLQTVASTTQNLIKLSPAPGSNSNGTLYAINVGAISVPGGSATETVLEIGAGWDNYINSANLSYPSLGNFTFTNASAVANSLVNLTSTGDFIIQDDGTAFATFNDTGGVTIAPNGASDFVVNTDANSNFQITQITAAPGVDMISISNSSFPVDTTSGVDALSINYQHTANGVNITGAAIDISATASGDAGDSIYGININTITANSSTQNAINIGGTGWDNAINIGSSNTAITTTTGLNIESWRVTTGNAIHLGGSNISGGLFTLTNAIVKIDPTRLSTNTGSNPNETGNYLAINRTYTFDETTAKTFTRTAAADLVALTSNCTGVNSGVCVDESSLLDLDQQLTSATGPIINIVNAGTGADIAFNTSPIVDIGNGGTLTFRDGTNTLCTISDAGSTGNLSCTGTITGPTTGTVGYWTRAGTKLSPATALDTVQINNVSSTSTTGELELDVTSSTTANSGINLNYNVLDNGSDTTQVGFDITFDNDDTSLSGADVFYAQRITNSNNASASNITTALLALDNADTTASSLLSGITFLNSGTTSGSYEKGIDFTAVRGFGTAGIHFSALAGNLISNTYTGSNTQTNTITGVNLNFNSNFTPLSGSSITGYSFSTPAITTTSGTTTYTGFSIPTAGALSNSTAGSITWNGANFALPAITQGSGGSTTANGIRIAIPASGAITTAGTMNALNIVAPTTSGPAAGTLNGINIGALASAGAATETAINIGSGWDTAIQLTGANTIGATGATTLSSTQTFGYLLTINPTSTVTYSSGATGIYLDMDTDYNASSKANKSFLGQGIILPGGMSNLAVSTTLKALSVAAASGLTTTAGDTTFTGLDVAIPTLTETAGTLTAYGIDVSNGAAGAGSTLRGINIGNTSGASTDKIALNIGTGWDAEINLADTTPTIGIGNSGTLSFTDGTNNLVQIVDGTNTDLNINHTSTNDPRLAFQFSGTSAFTLGVDNSDNDIFKIGTTALETNTFFKLDSRTTTSDVSAITLQGLTPTIASSSTAEYRTLSIIPPTINLTGSNQITSMMESVFIGQPTLYGGASLTIDNAATLYIEGAPLNGGFATITNQYALYIATGFSYLNGIKVGDSQITYPGGAVTSSLDAASGGGELQIGYTFDLINFGDGDDTIQIYGDSSSNIGFTNFSVAASGHITVASTSGLDCMTALCALNIGTTNAGAITIGNSNTEFRVASTGKTTINTGASALVSSALTITSTHSSSAYSGLEINTTVSNSSNSLSAAKIIVSNSTTGTGAINGLLISDLTGTGTGTGVKNGLSIGSNWDNAISADGDIRLGKKTDSTTAFSRVSQTTAGTIAASGTASIDNISASAVYNGSLFVGTSKSNAAEVYRYDGGTTWTKVSQTTAGTIASGGTASIDGVVSMTVYNGQLYIGTNEASNAQVYRYDGGTTWTVINTTSGRFETDTAIDKVSAMTVYAGNLYIGISKANAAEVYRYNGSTGTSVFSEINTTAGTFNTTGSVDGVTSMVVYNNKLYIGTNESNSAQVLSYDGNIGAAVFTRVNTTAGTFNSTASIDAVTAMAVYNGSLYIGTSDSTALAQVYRYDGVTTGAAVFTVINTTAGTFNSTASIDAVTAMAVYNGMLYIGTSETNVAQVLRYDGGIGSAVFTMISSAAGTVSSGAQANVDTIASLQTFNGNLYAGTSESAVAEVHAYTSVEGQSYALKFNGASDNGGTEQGSFLNLGAISFLAEQNAFNNTGNADTGQFLFTHSITTATGAYDVAEDYPTRDDSLQPGDIVAIDPFERGFVRKVTSAYDDTVLGVYSSKPALHLSQKDSSISGGQAVAVALVGRVPVKVSTENGPIQPGDSLTSSSKPGVAMKATQPGTIVGKALEPFTATDTNTVGKILIAVKTSYWAPSLTDTNNQTAQINLETINTTDLIAENITTTNLTVHGSLITDSLVIADKIKMNKDGKLEVDGEIIVAGKISLSGDIFISGRVDAKTVAATEFQVKGVENNPSATAGSATIISGTDELIIQTTKVDDKTLVFVTPTSPTEKQLAVIEKITGTSFKVKLNSLATTDITFNWLIVNQQISQQD